MELVQVVPVHSVPAALAALDSLAVELEVMLRCLVAVPRASGAADPERSQAKADHVYSLIILDSATALVSPGLGTGAAGSMQGHVLMGLLARQLRACAQKFQLAVLMTNTLVGGEPRARCCRHCVTRCALTDCAVGRRSAPARTGRQLAAPRGQQAAAHSTASRPVIADQGGPARAGHRGGLCTRCSWQDSGLHSDRQAAHSSST